MKFSPVWSQSLTYTLFTLIPILLFALVTLWKLKMSYDTDIFQLRRNLNKIEDDLNKSVVLNVMLTEDLRKREDTLADLEEENAQLGNKTVQLKASVKKVEERALNLTSKLLLREMEVGLMKKEKIRLEGEVQRKEQTDQGDKSSKTGDESLVNAQSPPSKFKVKNSRNSSKSGETIENDKLEMVDKLLDIKKKQKELEEAKQELFSGPVADSKKTKIIAKVKKAKLAPPLEVENTDDIQAQIGNVNETHINQLIKIPESAKPKAEAAKLSLPDHESNHTEVTKGNATKPEEKKVHIMIDVKNINSIEKIRDSKEKVSS